MGPDNALNQSQIGSFVAANLPGTGPSGGCYDRGGAEEQHLLAAFIEGLAQESWSTGNIGLWGRGFDGTTEWEAAIHAPPHLRTLISGGAVTDHYDYVYEDGAAYSWYGPYYLADNYAYYGLGVDLVNVPPGANVNPNAAQRVERPATFGVACQRYGH